jgi:hypothetical protein
MLRELAFGSLWEAVLSAKLRELPPELAKVDAILDDDRFLAPFRLRLAATRGRPTRPIDTCLRVNPEASLRAGLRDALQGGGVLLTCQRLGCRGDSDVYPSPPRSLSPL